MNDKTVIIISDLDGTLLDHETYQFDAARSALDQIRQLNIPLILNSSKTAPEMMLIRDALDNNDPFVVENGAGIYLPEGIKNYKKIKFGKDREQILSSLKNIKEKLNVSFTGFNDMSAEELSVETGLSKDQAILAKQRDYTEPLKWEGSEQEWNQFISELKCIGLTAVKGGRYVSVSSTVDKGQALSWLRNYYQEQTKLQTMVIALGDSENDKSMLANADYSILVKSPVHDFPEINAKNLILTTEFGPKGWNNSLLNLLESLNTGGNDNG
jgi:mannosyl-3-phosphoglycerate phosphatase family protein